MNGWLANTDFEWYSFLLEQLRLEEINFWQPSGGRGFHVLSPGEPLLFKLKSPHNAIAGFGHFVRHSVLPAWLAWDAFGPANGAPDFLAMRKRIERYRHSQPSDPTAQYPIGCLILGEPVLFPRELWVPQPEDWARQAVQGKTYDLEAGEGKRVWQQCLLAARSLNSISPLPRLGEQEERFGTPTTVKPRLGQGSFRVVVLENYQRACAVSSEHSLPALEAAHIKPYSEGGDHNPRNGILLRSDIHRLFDKGYMTITPEKRIEVSKRLKEDFDNGRTYYPYHGSSVTVPDSQAGQPDAEMLRWHNENRFLA